MRLKAAISQISRKTIVLMNCLLPFMLLAFVWFAVSYIKAVNADPILAEYVYRPISDHIFLSLALIIGGGVIFDCSIANGDLKK